MESKKEYFLSFIIYTIVAPIIAYFLGHNIIGLSEKTVGIVLVVIMAIILVANQNSSAPFILQRSL